MIEQTSTTKGKLYIVATPIGNLNDLSVRAKNTLAEVDLILAEDTRHSQKLLQQLGLNKRLNAFHAHNENASERIDQILNLLNQGLNIALISDAGTPLISDPGFPLVAKARIQGFTVIPVPGPCALIAALSAAGIPSETFTFCGFLPAKSQQRQQMLLQWQAISHTLVFYEAPHRIIACLEDILHVFGPNCKLVLAKELTKIYETIIHGPVEEIISWLNQEQGRLKGEFVLMIAPREQKKENDFKTSLHLLLEHLPLKQAVSLTVQLTKASKNEVYQAALAWQRTDV